MILFLDGDIINTNHITNVEVFSDDRVVFWFAREEGIEFSRINGGGYEAAKWMYSSPENYNRVLEACGHSGAISVRHVMTLVRNQKVGGSPCP